MFWVALAIFIIGYLIFQEIERHNKKIEELNHKELDSPESIIEDLEKRANFLKEDINEDIKRTKRNYPDLDDGENKRLLNRLRNTESIYKRLKEKFRHSDTKQRINIAEDRLHYIYFMGRRTARWSYLVLPGDGADNDEEREKEMSKMGEDQNEEEISIDEIEKRFKKLLKLKV